MRGHRWAPTLLVSNALLIHKRSEGRASKQASIHILYVAILHPVSFEGVFRKASSAKEKPPKAMFMQQLQRDRSPANEHTHSWAIWAYRTPHTGASTQQPCL